MRKSLFTSFKSGFVPVLIVFILGLVIVGVLYLFGRGFFGVSPFKTSPSNVLIDSKRSADLTSPDKTMSAKLTELRDTKYYSLKYQNYWNSCNCGDIHNLNSFQLNSKVLKPGEKPLDTAIVAVSVMDAAPGKQTIDEQTKVFVNCDNRYICNVSDTTVGGQAALISEMTGLDGLFYSKEVWVKKLNTIYSLKFSIDGKTKDTTSTIRQKYLADFDAIVSTLAIK